jgi:hypothetical protein
MTKMLNDNQKEMVADLLLRTKTKKDIEENANRIMGNAYGDVKTVKVYRELANMKVELKT